MPAYVAKRLITMVPVLFAIITISFFVMRLAPGGPFDKDRVMPAEVRANIEKKYHLDESPARQYLRYMLDVARLDLGPSFKYADRSVNDIIREHAPISLRLGVMALALALLIGIPAGCIAALRQNSVFDYSAMAVALTGISIPNFVIASVLMYVFAIRLSWLPVAGWDTWRNMVLPVITLSLYYTAFVARLSRAGLLEVINQDYIRTARAKGLPERVVLVRHALRGGLLPVVTYLGPATAAILTGSLVVEKIYGIPGIGSEFVNSALNRDYTLVLGTVILYSTFLIMLNLVVDVLYTYLDPRIEFK
jgi:oligopeptide transport system permease protein